MIVSLSELYQAYKKCKKNKAKTINAIKFEVYLIDNLYSLYEDINSWRYEPSEYICFMVNSPKLREVFASDFRDRVVHHLLVSDLEPLFEPRFIYDSYSCRVNKGTHKAVQRVQSFARKKQSIYYMQLDIKNFFLSINKNILFERIRKVVMRRRPSTLQRILYLSYKIIFDNPASKFIYKGDFDKHSAIPSHKTLLCTPPHQGLPIGNLTSQFFANVYLDMMDNYIKRVLKVKCYVRYVDDFVLFGESKEQLIATKLKIEQFLAKRLKLSLRESYKISKVENGIDFLGYIIRPNYILVRERVVNNFKQKKAKFYQKHFKTKSCSYEAGQRYKQIVASYHGHFSHANSYKLINKLNIKGWI